nr:hypothetical protein [uncultured Sphingosinicella sp.]
MTQKKGDDNRNSVNAGPVPTLKDTGEFDGIVGNVREKGEDPSPDNRSRGERTSRDTNSPVDIANG